jgi:hypothetical protein
VLHSFGKSNDGALPVGGLVLGANTDLYGVTASGGAFEDCNSGTIRCGTVFEISPSESGTWMEQVLYSFCSDSGCSDGAVPQNGLIFDTSGNLYGTTAFGGASGMVCVSNEHGCGTVFELQP